MPSSTVRTFTDPDAFYGAIRNMVEGVVTAAGSYRAQFTRVDFDRVWTTRGDENLARVLTLTARVERAMILFATDQNQSPTHIAGIEVAPDEAAVISSGFQDHLLSSGASRWGGISLPLRDLAAAGRVITGRELTPPLFAHRIRPAAAPLLSRLRNLHEAAGHLAKNTPDILAKPEVARAMEQGLAEAMILCLAGSDAVEVRSIQRHHAAVMRRLEEALGANAEEPLYISDLCAAVGVSYPTLRACCQEHLGMSPKRYLLLRRMHLARRALRNGDPEKTNVTEVATNYGFWELGRFSVAYRSLFGESPSTTLRRPPDDPKPNENAGSPWQFSKTA
jgi:AraC-like DNA-binding protein